MRFPANVIPALRTPDAGDATAGTARLRRLEAFGSNPGALDGWFYVPADTGAAVPLVVVLHGCTQTAAGYDRGSGWSELAERYGFAVLFPEQRRANNPNGCFNWFLAPDIAREGGEAQSIRQMIGAVADRHAIDPARRYVTGLSAGGAMACAMLAAWPELFAGGAIVAGLPFGVAGSVSQALERMRGHGLAGADALAALVRGASAHAGPWPAVSVWHGDADRTVAVANADAIVGQWRTLHGAGAEPDRSELIDGHRRRVWLGADGREAVEEYRIAGLGHGTPLKTHGPDGCGVPGPHMLEAGISSTWRQAERWGLIDPAAVSARPVRAFTAAVQSGPRRVPDPAPPAAPSLALPSPVLRGPGAAIERALRSAGLMR